VTPEQQSTIAQEWRERYRPTSKNANGTHGVFADAIVGNTPETVEAAVAPTAATPTLAGDVREVSVVMADLRGFTAFCERVPPVRMSRVLNEYLGAMVDVILGQRGRVQDFVGDGILGVFGAPALDSDHAWHAALTAIQMQRAMRKLGERWGREEGLTFSLGVAVHSGQVFAGSVGCPKRRKYAAVGDPVNTVARLEELNRDLGTWIVISGDSLARVRDRVDVNRKGLFTVRGRSHPVEVFELLGVREPRDHLIQPVNGEPGHRSSTSGRAPRHRGDLPALPLLGDHGQVGRRASGTIEGESR
jgi:class 3 adenylate cyclase